MKKLLLLVNLYSGKAYISAKIGEVISFYNSKGYKVEVYCSQYRGSVVDRIKAIDESYSNIIVCGGDGTFNEAVNGIMSIKRNIPLGYIPCGSTNDFANSVGIPSDLKEAVLAAVDGKSIKVDIGNFNGRYFTYVTGFGAFTNLSYDTPQDIKNILGYQAYILKGIQELSSIKTYNMQIKTPRKTFEGEFILGLVSNSNRIAGVNTIVPTDYNDGLFEVFLIKKPNLLTAIPIIVSSIIEGNFDNELFVSFKTSDIKFTCNEPVAWTLDGEYAGFIEKAKIKVENSALEIKRGFMD